MRSRRPLGRLGVLLIGGWIAPALPATAQTVFDRLEVGVTEVEVTVRDRKGRAVAGLPRESFSVSLDGVELPITHFAAYAEGREATAGEPTGRQVLESIPVHVAIFFDQSGFDAGERADLVRRLGRSLAHDLAPATRVLVAGRDGPELRFWAPFTDDAARLVEAVAEAATGVPRSDAAAGMHELLREIERVISLLDEAQAPSGRGQARVLAARGAAYASELIQEVERSADVLERLVTLMSGLPGRKAILYVGDTLAMNPGELIDGTLRNAFTRFGFSSWTEHVDATPAFSGASGAIAGLAERAAARRVLLYTLDPTGGRLPSLASAAESSLDAGRSGGSQPAEAWTPGIAARRRTEVQGAFRMMAEASGGMILGGLGDDVLGRVVFDLETYYSLGVRPPADDGGRAPSLEIRVEGGGLQVQRRRAHRTRSADEVDADRTVAALLPGFAGGAPGAGRIAASLAAGEPEPGAAGLYTVSLSVRVPVAQVAVIARDRAHAGQLSIFYATGGRGLHFSEVRKIVLPITIANDELAAVAGSMAEHRIGLELAPGPTRVAVGVRDDYDPELTLLTLDLDVGARAPSPASP